jgi:hypothetical protein
MPVFVRIAFCWLKASVIEIHVRKQQVGWVLKCQWPREAAIEEG